jgi:hypothetical protein
VHVVQEFPITHTSSLADNKQADTLGDIPAAIPSCIGRDFSVIAGGGSPKPVDLSESSLQFGFDH